MSMSRRARRLCGALSLVAMTLSLAEAGAASVCAPMEGMGEMGDMDGAPPSMVMEASTEASISAPAPAALEGGDDCTDCGRASGESQDGQESSCPWMPLMVTGCVAPSALRSSSPRFAASVLERDDEAVAVRDRPASHVTDPLFHPPRR